MRPGKLPTFATFARKQDPREQNYSPQSPHLLRRQQTRKVLHHCSGAGGGGGRGGLFCSV